MMNHKGTFFYGSTEKVLTEKNISCLLYTSREGICTASVHSPVDILVLLCQTDPPKRISFRHFEKFHAYMLCKRILPHDLFHILKRLIHYHSYCRFHPLLPQRTANSLASIGNSVSYTHLDVYKRQPVLRLFLSASVYSPPCFLNIQSGSVRFLFRDRASDPLHG